MNTSVKDDRRGTVPDNVHRVSYSSGREGAVFPRAIRTALRATAKLLTAFTRTTGRVVSVAVPPYGFTPGAGMHPVPSSSSVNGTLVRGCGLIFNRPRRNMIELNGVLFGWKYVRVLHDYSSFLPSTQLSCFLGMPIHAF